MQFRRDLFTKKLWFCIVRIVKHARKLGFIRMISKCQIIHFFSNFPICCWHCNTVHFRSEPQIDIDCRPMKATIARRSENTTHTAVGSIETHWLKAVININFVINGHRDFWRCMFKHTKRPVNNFKLCVCFKCLPPHCFLLSLIILRQLKTPKRLKNSSPISQLASTTLQ